MGYIKGQDRNQIILFPEAIDDYVSEDSVVRVIDEYIDQLDMVELGFTRATPAYTGRPPYDPKDLLKLYIYGYLNRVRSSRRLEQEAGRNLEVIWLLNKLQPDFKTIADFRKDNKKALAKVFRDFTRLCSNWDLFGKELVAIDGTKFRASNSKKNNYSKRKLQRLLASIDKRIDAYLEELDQLDGIEECDRKPDAKEIKKRLQELKDRKQKYEGFEKKIEDQKISEISTTDPDARLMSNNNGSVDVGYNVQTTVDSKHKMIVDFEVIRQPNDLGQLAKMAIRSKNILGVDRLEAVADKGYYKVDDLKACLENGITPFVAKQAYGSSTGIKEFNSDKFTYVKDEDIYICPCGHKLPRWRTRNSKGRAIGYDYKNSVACKACSHLKMCTKSAKGRTIFRNIDQDLLDPLDIRLEDNKAKYKQRQMIVEHPFGTIKRSWGAYYFLTRRKASVTAEVALLYLAYNLKRAINVLGVKKIIQMLKGNDAVTA